MDIVAGSLDSILEKPPTGAWVWLPSISFTCAHRCQRTRHQRQSRPIGSAQTYHSVVITYCTILEILYDYRCNLARQDIHERECRQHVFVECVDQKRKTQRRDESNILDTKNRKLNNYSTRVRRSHPLAPATVELLAADNTPPHWPPLKRSHRLLQNTFYSFGKRSVDYVDAEFVEIDHVQLP